MIDVCWKVMNYTHENTWVGNDYTHVWYKIEKQLIQNISVSRNEITSYDFQYFHKKWIPMECYILFQIKIYELLNFLEMLKNVSNILKKNKNT